MTSERKAGLMNIWEPVAKANGSPLRFAALVILEFAAAFDAAEQKTQTAVQEERERCLKIALSRDLTTHEIKRKIWEGK